MDAKNAFWIPLTIVISLFFIQFHLVSIKKAIRENTTAMREIADVDNNVNHPINP